MKLRRLKSTPHLNASETYLGITVLSTQLHKRHQAAPSKEEERRGCWTQSTQIKDRPADPMARGSSGRRSPWTSGVHPRLAGHPFPPPFPPRPAFSFLHLSSSASSVSVVGGGRHVTVARTAEKPSSRKAARDCRESTAIVPESSSQKAARGAPPCLGGGSLLTLPGRGGAF